MENDLRARNWCQGLYTVPRQYTLISDRNAVRITPSLLCRGGISTTVQQLCEGIYSYWKYYRMSETTNSMKTRNLDVCSEWILWSFAGSNRPGIGD